MRKVIPKASHVRLFLGRAAVDTDRPTLTVTAGPLLFTAQNSIDPRFPVIGSRASFKPILENLIGMLFCKRKADVISIREDGPVSGTHDE